MIYQLTDDNYTILITINILLQKCSLIRLFILNEYTYAFQKMGDVLLTFSLSSEWRCVLKYDILIKLFHPNMKEYSLQNLMQQNEPET